jgi:hypothetical protein
VTKSVASNSVTRSVKNTNSKIPTPSRVRHSDLDSVQMRSREGLFSCESLPLNRYRPPFSDGSGDSQIQPSRYVRD